MGLGGGFLMTIWDAKKKEASFLDARESAPAAAKENMFDGDARLAMYGKILLTTQKSFTFPGTGEYKTFRS